MFISQSQIFSIKQVQKNNQKNIQKLGLIDIFFNELKTQNVLNFMHAKTAHAAVNYSTYTFQK